MSLESINNNIVGFAQLPRGINNETKSGTPKMWIIIYYLCSSSITYN